MPVSTDGESRVSTSSANNTGSNTKEVAVKVAADGTIAFDTVVFDATADLRVIDSSSYAYAFRGHRWAF